MKGKKQEPLIDKIEEFIEDSGYKCISICMVYEPDFEQMFSNEL